MAAVELGRGVPVLNWRPEVLHLNDWPGALAAGYLHWQKVGIPSILTIHNLAYQGLFGRDRLDRLAIPAEAFAMDGVEFHNHGRRELKGIGRVDVFELVYDGSGPHSMRAQPRDSFEREWSVLPPTMGLTQYRDPPWREGGRRSPPTPSTSSRRRRRS